MSEVNSDKQIKPSISSLAKDDEFRAFKYSVVAELTDEEFNELKKIRSEIINKIQLVLNNITPQALKRASLSSRGTTLKSLMNAFHIVQLHLRNEEQDTQAKTLNAEMFKVMSTLPGDKQKISSQDNENEDEYEDVLQSIQNYVAIQKKTFIKQKRFD